jgi:acylpyruvate hydrolase
MRFRVLETTGREGVAVSRDGREWHALYRGEAGFPGFPDDFIAGGPTAIRTAAEAIARGAPVADIDAAHCLPPFRRAGKILCVGLNYAAHVKESGMQTPARPTVFARFNTGLVGHGSPLVRPTSSDQLDYESELAVIIGKRARHVSEDVALDHVAGYSIFNDGSIRDVQLLTPQWTIGKNFDGTGAFGPCIVTADELPPGGKGLRIQGRLNGVVMQNASTDDMIFGVAETIVLLSECMTLEPADVIVMGTPAGVGAGRKPQVWMNEGDVFEVDIERVGLLTNTVRKEENLG